MATKLSLRLLIISTVLSLFLLRLDAAAGESRPKLTILGGSAGGTPLAVWVAREQGLFIKHGLDVDYVFVGSPTTAVSALLAGQTQFVFTGSPAILSAATRGADAVIIACLANRDSHMLMTRPEFASVRDLYGKK